LFGLLQRPRAIRCYNRPELTSEAFTAWCPRQDIVFDSMTR